MLNDFVEKVQGFIMKPVETFQKIKGGSLGDAFIYYLILLVIYAILSTIVLAIGMSAMSVYQSIPGFKGAVPVVMFFGTLIGGIIGIFIGGAWLHIFVWALGGKKGYVQTVKSIMYGSTPGLLLGWIPIIGFIGGIWTIVLDIFGIKELQEMSMGRAVAAVVIAGVILIIIVLVIAISAFMAVMGAVSGAGAY
ncbi:MAG TPA: YIP1 family protein [Methanoregulaceae archaeon]|nr:YIP1 family protein [Methanoregulaceae archaeon]